MKKVIALSAVVVLLYSCATIDTKNTQNHVVTKKSYSNLAERLKMIEQRITENSVNIRNNSIRLNRLDTRLLIIQKRIEKEMLDSNMTNYIPPASEITGKNTKTSAAGEKPKPANIFETKPKKQGKYDGLVNIVEVSKPHTKKKEPAKKTKNSSDVDKALYQAALELYNHNDFEGSKRLFENFIKNHPHSRYVDNAMFWLAYTYLHLDELQKGVDMLKKIVDEYPNNSVELGGKTDAALYALIRLYRNNKNESDRYKDILFKRFPKSRYVKLLKK
jgi:TolA-binding protein